MNFSQLLEQGLGALDFSPEEIPVVQQKLEGYIRELMLFNAAYDLVGAENQEQIVVNHILDSLAGWRCIRELALERQQGRQESVLVADIGSGGGLPGIPRGTLPQKPTILSVLFPSPAECPFCEPPWITVLPLTLLEREQPLRSAWWKPSWWRQNTHLSGNLQ